MLVRRKLAESAIVEGLAEQLSRAEQIRHVIERVAAEVAMLSEHLPETIRAKECPPALRAGTAARSRLQPLV